MLPWPGLFLACSVVAVMLPTPASAASHWCTAREVKVVEAASDGDAGENIYTSIRVTNIGHRTCDLQGFPVVKGKQAGKVVITSEHEDSHLQGGYPDSLVLLPPLIHLAPGQPAATQFTETMFQQSRPTWTKSCPEHTVDVIVLPHQVEEFPLEGPDKVHPWPATWYCQYRIKELTPGEYSEN